MTNKSCLFRLYIAVFSTTVLLFVIGQLTGLSMVNGYESSEPDENGECIEPTCPSATELSCQRGNSCNCSCEYLWWKYTFMTLILVGLAVAFGNIRWRFFVDRQAQKQMDAEVAAATAEMRESRPALEGSMVHAPVSGTYQTEDATLHLQFTPNNGGWSISGHGERHSWYQTTNMLGFEKKINPEGKFQIVRGFVSMTGQAYWEEKYEFERHRFAKKRCLNEGVFDFEKNFFAGNWTRLDSIYDESSLSHGVHASFHLVGRLSGIGSA